MTLIYLCVIRNFVYVSWAAIIVQFGNEPFSMLCNPSCPLQSQDIVQNKFILIRFHTIQISMCP